jgi:hypothetical protein
VKDTSDVIAKKYFDMLMARSGEERLKMGCAMHMTAKAMVRASILAANPSATQGEIRKVMFLRFYEQDFDSAAREKILRSLDR